MELKYRLLNHPFYQAWENGSLSRGKMSAYADAYLEFIEEIPKFWEKVVREYEPESPFAGRIVEEETWHIGLWKLWQGKLKPSPDTPSMADTIGAFNKMSPSELLGALHSFEIQQPKVAHTKKQCLMKYYGFDEKDLRYFDEHMNEDNHINFGRMLYEKKADRKEFETGFDKGAWLIYKSLDKFLD